MVVIYTGRSSCLFKQISDTEASYGVLEKLVESPRALIALNDGMGEREEGSDRVNQTLQAWHERLFGKKLEFEY